jgi:hypothetical protein
MSTLGKPFPFIHAIDHFLSDQRTSPTHEIQLQPIARARALDSDMYVFIPCLLNAHRCDWRAGDDLPRLPSKSNFLTPCCHGLDYSDEDEGLNLHMDSSVHVSGMPALQEFEARRQFAYLDENLPHVMFGQAADVHGIMHPVAFQLLLIATSAVWRQELHYEIHLDLLKVDRLFYRYVLKEDEDTYSWLPGQLQVELESSVIDRINGRR